MSHVLTGLRVLEIAGIGPGPFCDMLLADLGADVITVERPVGNRAQPRPAQIVQRGKRSIVLDLKSPGAVETVLKIIERSDALIEGMRPGVMERLGLGPDTCLSRNPALVYGRMTGWGQTGPLAQAAGHDSNYTGLAGALWYASPPDTPQHAPPTFMGDVGGGALYLAIGILAGVLSARTEGRGQVVDAAIVDGSAHMLNLLLSMVASLGGNFSRGAHMFDASHWAGRSYLCADGNWINLAPLEPQFYAELIERLGLAGDERFVKGQMNPALWPELSGVLKSLFAEHPRDHWCNLLEGTDCCFAPVLAPDEAAKHPHMTARSVYTTVDQVLHAAPAPRFSHSSTRTPATIPIRGAHTEAILREAGITTEAIAELACQGALGESPQS